MGIAIGVLLIALTISSFVLVNIRATRMARRYNDQPVIDPQTGQPVPPQHGHSHHHGGLGGHGGGHSGGGHVGGGHSGGGHDAGGGGGHH